MAQLIATYGYATIAGVVALESLGLPLPGEATLIGAALIASASRSLDPWLVVAAAAAGASLGGSAGFAVGRRFGYRLLRRYGHRIHLTAPRIKLGQYLFRLHGGLFVFLGRFVFVLRPLVAILAGANRMSWPGFLLANTLGAAVWAAGYGMAAYALGKEVRRFAAPMGIALAAIAAILCVVGVIYLRRHEARLEDAAERASPGPLREP